MKKSCFTKIFSPLAQRTQKPQRMSYQKQRGDFLVEAMIGALIMGIVGAGISTIAGKVSTSQTALEVQNRAIGDLKSLLIEGDTTSLCAGTATVRNALKGTEQAVAVPAACYTAGAPGSAEEASQANPQLRTTVLKINDKDIKAPKPIVLNASVDIPNTGSNGNLISVPIRVGQHSQ